MIADVVSRCFTVVATSDLASGGEHVRLHEVGCPIGVLDFTVVDLSGELKTSKFKQFEFTYHYLCLHQLPEPSLHLRASTRFSWHSVYIRYIYCQYSSSPLSLVERGGQADSIDRLIWIYGVSV